MDTSKRRPTESASDAVKNTCDWRAQMQRETTVNKIMDILKRHLPFYGHEEQQELRKIAQRVEEEIYTAATSQSEYSRKICFMMLSMETGLQNPSKPLCMQEEVYQKIKAMKDLYLPDLNNLHQKVVSKVQQQGAGFRLSDKDERRERKQLRGYSPQSQYPAGFTSWPPYEQTLFDLTEQGFGQMRSWMSDQEEIRTVVIWEQQRMYHRIYVYTEHIRVYHDVRAGVTPVPAPAPVVNYQGMLQHHQEGHLAYPHMEPPTWRNLGNPPRREREHPMGYSPQSQYPAGFTSLTPYEQARYDLTAQEFWQMRSWMSDQEEIRNTMIWEQQWMYNRIYDYTEHLRIYYDIRVGVTPDPAPAPMVNYQDMLQHHQEGHLAHPHMEPPTWCNPGNPPRREREQPGGYSPHSQYPAGFTSWRPYEQALYDITAKRFGQMRSWMRDHEDIMTAMIWEQHMMYEWKHDYIEHVRVYHDIRAGVTPDPAPAPTVNYQEMLQHHQEGHLAYPHMEPPTWCNPGNPPQHGGEGSKPATTDPFDTSSLARGLHESLRP